MTDDEGEIVRGDDGVPLAKIRTIAHVMPVTPEAFDQNSITFYADARLAMGWWHDPEPPRRPTEEEAQETYDRRLAEHHALLERWVRFDASVEALAAVTDPLARKILDLHEAHEDAYSHGPECIGCEHDREEGYPHYPCDTVQIVAEHVGIVVEGPRQNRPTEPPTYQDPVDWVPPRLPGSVFVHAHEYALDQQILHGADAPVDPSR